MATELQWSVVTSSVPKYRIELVEEEVYTVLRNVGEEDPKRWIFDTGPSNHMTDIKEVFVDLDNGVVSIARFDDGSVVQIKDCITILFASKNREHKTLVNTYYIPHLTANILSCEQLDEGGFQIHIEGGFMRIHDEQMWLLVKICRND
jgi:hypothetical protein